TPAHGAGGSRRCDPSAPAAIGGAQRELSGPRDAPDNVAGIPGPRPAGPVIAAKFLPLRRPPAGLLPRMARWASVVSVASAAAQIGAEQVAWRNSHLGRTATPDDIAKVIAFVAVGDCGWLNGVDIVADGGATAGRLGGWIDVSQSPAMLARARQA